MCRCQCCSTTKTNVKTNLVEVAHIKKSKKDDTIVSKENKETCAIRNNLALKTNIFAIDISDISDIKSTEFAANIATIAACVAATVASKFTTPEKKKY